MSGDYEMLPGEHELWRNRQWAITTHSLNAIGHRSWFEYERFHEGSEGGYGWLQHMAGKKWVDIEALIEAYLIACTMRGIKYGRIADEIEKARERKKKRNRDRETFDCARRYFGYPKSRPYTVAEIEKMEKVGSRLDYFGCEAAELPDVPKN